MNKIERLKRIADALTLASSVTFTTGCYYDKTPDVQIEIQDNHDLPTQELLVNMLEEKTGTVLQPLGNYNLSFYYSLKKSNVWKVITFD